MPGGYWHNCDRYYLPLGDPEPELCPSCGRPWADPPDADGGGAHPDLAAHDALGLSTDSELTSHAGLPDVHHATTHAIDAAVHTGVLADAQIPATIARDTELHAQDHAARHATAGADAVSPASIGALTQAVADTLYAPVAEPNNATHLADAIDAHDASAISILDVALDFDATDVEGALAELQGDNEAHVAAADPHTGYVREADVNWVDLTDGGQTVLHSHAGGGGGLPRLIVPITSVQFTYTNLGVGPTAVAGAFNLNGWPVVDLVSLTNVKVACRVVTAGVTGDLRLQYSTDGTTWATLTTNLIDLSTTGLKQTALEAIPAGALGLVAIRPVGINGNGVEDPVVGGVCAMFT